LRNPVTESTLADSRSIALFPPQNAPLLAYCAAPALLTSTSVHATMPQARTASVPVVNIMRTLRIAFSLSALTESPRVQTAGATSPATFDPLDATSTTMLVTSHHRVTAGRPNMGIAKDAIASTNPT
jgi:hypothetical protein